MGLDEPPLVLTMVLKFALSFLSMACERTINNSQGEFHWQPAVFKIVQWWKEWGLLLPPRLWCACSVSLHPSQAASLPMSIIIVGVGPAEFDGEQGEDYVYVCVCAFVHASVYLQSVILCLHSPSYLASHTVLPFLVHLLFPPSILLSSLWIWSYVDVKVLICRITWSLFALFFFYSSRICYLSPVLSCFQSAALLENKLAHIEQSQWCSTIITLMHDVPVVHSVGSHIREHISPLRCTFVHSFTLSVANSVYSCHIWHL